MTVGNVYENFVKSLQPLYNRSDAIRISQWVMEDKLGISKTQLVLSGAQVISEVKANDLAWKLMRLLKGEPVQYVLGYTFFYGLKLKVNKSVLIPRPETEELVERVINDLKEMKWEGEFRILDIGTGSGCIAIAIKKNFPQINVFAIDISEEALKVAKHNAESNSAEINFLQCDILKKGFLTEKASSFNIIISNPPYIIPSEENTIHKNVIDFEPHLALFVSDDNPLLFYQAILDYAALNLRSNGRVYFETNSLYTQQVADFCSQKNFSKVEALKDMSGNERMVIACM